MTALEISLLIIGCIFMLGSFFVSEKLSSKELDKIKELSDKELKRIIESGIESAENQILNVVDEKVEEASEKVEVAMEKESNLKIMAIKEYSDTVLEDMKSTHDEVMFLYSMLNDKHTELTSLTGNLQRLAADIRNLQEGIQNKVDKKQEVLGIHEEEPERYQELPVMEMIEDDANIEVDTLTTVDNHNEDILDLYRHGYSKVDIAKNLGLGVGEVNLVIGLYKGDE